MGKSDRKYEIRCPECGAPIKKGFFTCSNCKLKVRMASGINRDQDKKSGSPPKANTKEKIKKETKPPEKEAKPPEKDAGTVPDKNPLKKSGHPRYWNF
jgi:hypothetical protein